MHVDRALRPLAEFERLMGDLYSYFAQCFAGDPEASSAFAALAADEASHANLIEFQRRLVRANPKQFGEIELDLGELFATRAQVERLRAQPTPPTVEEAIAFAFQLENTAAEYHFRQVLRQANPEIGQLLENLGKADRHHLARIMDLASARNVFLSE
ncbi:MAG TPA: hypothetical protein P5234_11375 [Thermoanaerobaculaceae bacterium]|nr:hypothetical protein [Thermoanaerobaculaceae bacterium]HRS16831.1 hypothetical protein [Thermoanaerobaculaceae bacterium]